MKPYYEDSHVTIWLGDCRDVLPQLPAGSVQTCVTSPPYFGLRDYGGAAQIGLEPTPAAYVAEMTGVFREVRRVLRDDGTCWLNLGDSFNGSGRGPTGENGCGDHERRQGFHSPSGGRQGYTGLKPKDLIGIPWRVAFALQEAGWWLRSEIIWHKPSAMPESVTDRPTKAHEQIFLLAKSERYFYDNQSIAEPVVKGAAGSTFTNGKTGVNGLGRVSEHERIEGTTRNKRSVWSVTHAGFKDAHFAVFPEKLIEPCILAGAPVGGVVLDPFLGSGTTARVAKRLGRRAWGIEQNEAYAEMAAASLAQGMFDLEAV